MSARTWDGDSVTPKSAARARIRTASPETMGPLKEVPLTKKYAVSPLVPSPAFWSAWLKTPEERSHVPGATTSLEEPKLVKPARPSGSLGDPVTLRAYVESWSLAATLIALVQDPKLDGFATLEFPAEAMRTTPWSNTSSVMKASSTGMETGHGKSRSEPRLRLMTSAPF